MLQHNTMNEQTYPKATFKGRIHVIVNDSDVGHALSKLSECRVIGFDTETKPSFKKGEVYGVALLQLSSDVDAFLFRLHHIKDFTPFVVFFENEKIIKSGVAIRDDLKALQKIIPFSPKGFVELADLAKEKNLKNFGLKGMTEEVLNLTLSKRAKLTNWEAKEYSEDQITYAALDAWIGREIYLALTLTTA